MRRIQTANLFAMAVLVPLALLNVRSVGGALQEADRPQTNIVRLVIDYGDGVEKHFTAIPWEDGMTALDAMEYAAGLHRGITFRYKGKGAMAFLTQIDDLTNEGGGADNRNWLYSVNGESARVSFGAYPLKPGDVVRWQFE